MNPGRSILSAAIVGACLLAATPSLLADALPTASLATTGARAEWPSTAGTQTITTTRTVGGMLPDLGAMVADASSPVGADTRGRFEMAAELRGEWSFESSGGGADDVLTAATAGGRAGTLFAVPNGPPRIDPTRTGKPPSVLTEVPIVPLPGAFGLAAAGLGLLLVRRLRRF